ncbi:hypothetical protein D6D12_07086 [Aureobasidium pullulans]|uniref:Uncharacterized protein n=1 Tax=Aureobasidium pullulans TaxID=5580 RepID=A0AB74JMB2_AURPU|nr:hypothetical protein D6D12_07086 [Aureobasidium pullulans]
MLDPTTLEYIRDLVEETINQALHLTKGASAHGPDLVVLETPGHLAVGQHNRTPITTPASGAHFPVPSPLPSLAWTLNRKSLAAPTASKFSPASSGDGPKTIITAEGFLRLTYRVDSDGKVLSDWVTMNDDVLRETTNVWCASKCTPSISCASMQTLLLSLYCLFSTKFAIQPGSLRKNQVIDAATLQQIKFVKRFFFTVFNDRYDSKFKSYNTASTYTAVSIQAAVNEYICFQDLLCNVGRGNPVFASLLGDIQ